MLIEPATTSLASDETEPTDRSMLILQYLTALIAGLAAALLAMLH